MAKDGPGGEKTEKPTPQRLKKARKEGQIPRTQELGTWLGCAVASVLLLADVALALLSRAAPALNIFSFGFPFKIMLTLIMLGLTFPLLPPALDALMDHAVRAMVSLRSG